MDTLKLLIRLNETLDDARFTDDQIEEDRNQLDQRIRMLPDSLPVMLPDIQTRAELRAWLDNLIDCVAPVKH